MTPQFTYPAIYTAAGTLAARSQKSYLRLIRTEYALLIVLAVAALDLSRAPIYYASVALIFLLSLSAQIARNWIKPEQTWYRGRALAESVKTSSWRYCMRAEPFGDADSLKQRRAEFRNHLKQILTTNRHIGDKLPPDSATEEQITSSMEQVRGLSLEDRVHYYDKYRILEQRAWYAKKAHENRLASQRWMVSAILVYLIAIALVLVRIARPDLLNLPIEPLIVIASSIVGWTQVKKYNELASSYTLTAHEIGIMRSRLHEIAGEEDFSEFINEAEQAFSREHTQWVARQQR